VTGILSILQWVVANWSLIATLFSSAASIALFFLHGNAQADLKELRNFVNSLQVSQTPIDPGSAQAQAETMLGKK
jgi:hypothetical protein